MKVKEILRITETSPEMAKYANDALRRHSRDHDPRVMSDDPRVRSQGYKADDEKHYQQTKGLSNPTLSAGRKVSGEEHFSKTGRKPIYFAPKSYVLYTPGSGGEIPEETKQKLAYLLKAGKVNPEYITRVKSLIH